MTWTDRQLAMLEAMGLGLWAPRATMADATAMDATAVDATTVTERVPGVDARGPGDGAVLADITDATGPCAACPRRMRPLAGRGAMSAPWLIVGAGPEADDAAEQQPFSGAAGRLLDQMLQAIGVSIGEPAGARAVLAVRCLPVEGRAPDPAQLAACGDALRAEIERAPARVVLALGRTAAQAVLGPEHAGNAVRGTVYRVGVRPVVVTHELAYLLRQPQAKAEAWADLCLAREAMAGTGELPPAH